MTGQLSDETPVKADRGQLPPRRATGTTETRAAIQALISTKTGSERRGFVQHELYRRWVVGDPTPTRTIDRFGDFGVSITPYVCCPRVAKDCNGTNSSSRRCVCLATVLFARPTRCMSSYRGESSCWSST